jgi:hypothetical protein
MTAALSLDQLEASLEPQLCRHPFAETSLELTRTGQTLMFCFACLGAFALPHRCPGCSAVLTVCKFGPGMRVLICEACASETIEARL